MALIVRYSCDRANNFGTCAAQSLPGRSEAEARQHAEQNGWHLRLDGSALCPTHAGTNRLAPRTNPIRLH